MPVKTEQSPIDAQVDRLRNIDRYATPGQVSEFRRILESHARTWEHAEAITTWIVDHCTSLPTPAELRAICEQVGVPNTPTPRATCTACGGSGWVYLPRLIGGVTYDCSARCVCRQGRGQ